ncbi:hypothetical protein BC937DRAFT_90078 [Endogone sp. FLAS-F59071]|nr:hypothetical protein BC937DRAFT_90078 [Endogone sp. FLAS-F59071]|eukprot:RUS17358.1 hypothetical protein BC937DRAFT_90078 [Endogone sp. FLAS-F59071]
MPPWNQVSVTPSNNRALHLLRRVASGVLYEMFRTLDLDARSHHDKMHQRDIKSLVLNKEQKPPRVNY